MATAFRERLPRVELKGVEVVSVEKRTDQPNRFQKPGEEAFKYDVRVKQASDPVLGTYWATYNTEVLTMIVPGQKYTFTVKVGNKKPREDGQKHEFPHLITIESAYEPGELKSFVPTAPSPAPQEVFGANPTPKPPIPIVSPPRTPQPASGDRNRNIAVSVALKIWCEFVCANRLQGARSGIGLLPTGSDREFILAVADIAEREKFPEKAS